MKLPAIHLRDRNPEMARAWRSEFAGRDVEISCRDIFANGIVAQAVVSPANSFGYMDGGIDLVYLTRWPEIQDEVQEQIKYVFFGELPVGQATAVCVNDPQVMYLLAAPTMRMPADVSDTANAYLAFRAVLIKAIEMDLSSILCPGFCTGVGRMTPEMAAYQMRSAYDKIREAAQSMRFLGGPVAQGAKDG